jgi:hypothetical protein
MLLILSAGSALAFEGRVVLQGKGTPVAGAEVSVLGWNVSQLTDQSGAFTWEPTPSTPFEVLVVLPAAATCVPCMCSRFPPRVRS